jgi:hypothetical protein
MRNQLRFVTGAAMAAIALMVFAATASAQKKKKEDAGTRTVQGMVVDADDKAVPGAVVQLKDMRSLQVRSFIAQDDGAYHFSGIKSDVDYQLKAMSQGSESAWKTLSVFDDRKTAIINLKLEKK